MALPIIFDRLISGDVVDSKRTKSLVSAPSAYCDDLIGCGNNTHARVGVSGTFNGRTQCGPVELAFQYSLSGLFALDTFIADKFPTNAPAPVTIMSQMRALLYSYLSSAVAVNYPSPAPYNAAPDDGFIRRGNAWYFFDPSPLNPTTVQTISVARVTPRFDVCSQYVAAKGSSSMQFTRVDKDCVPQLIAQVSLSLTYAGPDTDVITELYGTTAPAAPALQDTIGDSRMETLAQSVITAAALSANCANIGGTASALAGSTFAPLPFTVSLGA